MPERAASATKVAGFVLRVKEGCLIIKKQYAIVPEELVLDREVSFTAKGLYAYLILQSNLLDITAKMISLDMRENLDRVESALRELEAKGYVEDAQ